MNDFVGPHPVRREELAASQRLSLQCFPGFREELTEKDLLASYVPPRRGGVQVLSHRGVPVSQIGIYHSQVNLYGCPLRIASIGGVCTHPDYRGLGLATRLLETCVHKLVAEGARLMLVSGARNLYTRLGCVAAQDFEAIVLKPTFPKGAIDSQPAYSPAYSPATFGKVFSLRPATAADASLCARLYQSEAVHFVRRVEEFAEHFSRLEEFPRAEDWVVESQGQPLAYMFLGVPWEHWTFPTFPKGAIEPIPPLFPPPMGGGWGGGGQVGVREVVEYAGSRTALVAGLAQAVVQSKLAELRLLIPRQDVDLLQLLRVHAVTGDATPLIGHTMRVVNFPRLMSDLRPYVKARLTQDQRRGLRFEQEGDRCVIVRAHERLELDTATTTPLVMGSLAPAGVLTRITGQPGLLGTGVLAGSTGVLAGSTGVLAGSTGVLAGSTGVLAGSTGVLAGILSALFPLPSFLPGLNYR
jgi:GNAT superfamily N-acetyltransferase